MRAITMTCCAMGAVLIAMVFGGPTSAMAETTALCSANENPCLEGHRVGSVHLVSGLVELKGKIFGVTVTILCLSSLILGSVESTRLGNPLGITVTALTFSNCGTNAAHNNCTVTTITPGLLDVLKTAENLGTVTFLNTVVLKFCNLGILGNLHCDFGGPVISGFTIAGALHTASSGHGMITAAGVTKPVVEALSGPCPSTNTMTALYEFLEHVYVSS